MLEPTCFIVRIDLAKHVFYAIVCSPLLFTFCGQKVTSGSRLANQHYLSACFLGRCCIGHVSQSPMALGRDRKTRFSSFAQTIDTMHSLRRVAYFASDSLMNPNPLRSFLSEKEVHSISQSIVVFPADLK